MKTTIYNLVKERQHVSFAELDRIDGFAGELAMVHSQDANLILWHSISEDGLEALSGLLDSNKIYIHPASNLTYLVDGKMPKLPTANRPPKSGYKKPHWFPICFCDYPYNPDAKTKKK